MNVIAIVALKGGVGKTITTVNLADNLERQGKSVCVIDVDPQANTSRIMGLDNDEGLYLTSFDLLKGSEEYWQMCQNVPGRNISGIMGTMDLFGLDSLCSVGEGDGKAVQAIRRFCEDQDGRYDYVLIDCPPGFTVGSVAAIMAADLIISPVCADDFSMIGIFGLHNQICGLLERLGRVVDIFCVLTRVDQRDVAMDLRRALTQGGFYFSDTMIRSSPKVPQSTFAREFLNEFSPYCSAARDYRALAKEVIMEMEVPEDGEEV